MIGWALLPDLVLFVVVAAACWVELARGKDSFDASTSSTGSEMRRRIQILLLIANVVRCLCVMGEVLLYERRMCPALRACSLVRCAPDLLFLTTYSVLILFWAQLSDTAAGVRLPLLRPAFFVANASLYLSFLLVLVLSATILSTLQVLQALFSVLGVFYVLATLFLLKYGMRMMRFSHTALPSVVLRRLVLLCGVLAVACLLHGVYMLGVASGLLPWDNSYPPYLDAPVFDALYHPLLEVLPSAFILSAIHRKKGHPSPPIYYLDSMAYTQVRSYTTPGHRLSHSGEQLMSYGGPSQVVKEGQNGVMGLYTLEANGIHMAPTYQASV